jgi:hypothetical protein
MLTVRKDITCVMHYSYLTIRARTQIAIVVGMNYVIYEFVSYVVNPFVLARRVALLQTAK